MSYEQKTRTNFKTGNIELLKLATAVVDKKSGEVLPIYKTFFEVGSQLYKIELSDCKKETKDGNPAMWCKITKLAKKQTQTNQRF